MWRTIPRAEAEAPYIKPVCVSQDMPTVLIPSDHFMVLYPEPLSLPGVRRTKYILEVKNDGKSEIKKLIMAKKSGT